MSELGPVAIAVLIGVLYDPTWKGPFQPDPRLALVFAAGAVLLAVLFGLALERRARGGGAGKGWARAYLLFRFHALGLYAAAVHLFHWPVVAGAIGVGSIGTAVTLVVLAPFLVFQGVVWVGIRRIEGARTAPLGAWLGYHYRSVVLLLAPYFLYAAAADVFGRWERGRIVVESWTLAGWGAMTAMFVPLLVLFPLLARRLWKTSPLEVGPLRDRLEAAAARLSFRCRDILLWDTGNLATNAAILGLFPRFRYVVLTDGLVRSLGPEEVEAVFGHEVGHARCRHVATFFLFAAAWALLVALAARTVLPESEEARLGVFLLSGAGWWVGFGWLSRRFELEADLFGAAAVQDVGKFVAALEAVGRLSGRGRWHASWRHFSVGSRVAFLRLVGVEPAIGRAFRAKLRPWVRFGAALFVFAAALSIYDLAGRTPGELGHAYLRLGDYAQAERLLSRASSEDAKARERLDLARFALSFKAEVGPDPPRGRFLGKAREAFRAGYFKAARQFLELAAYAEEENPAGRLLREASQLLEEGDLAELRRFLHGRGRALLDDRELAPTLRARGG